MVVCQNYVQSIRRLTNVGTTEGDHTRWTFLPSEPPKSVTYGDFMKMSIVQCGCMQKLYAMNLPFDQSLYY